MTTGKPDYDSTNQNESDYEQTEQAYRDRVHPSPLGKKLSNPIQGNWWESTRSEPVKLTVKAIAKLKRETQQELDISKKQLSLAQSEYLLKRIHTESKGDKET